MKAALVALLACACAVSASAAEPQRNDALALEAMQNYSKCVVGRARPGAEKLLAMDFRSPEYGKMMKAYARGHGYCAWNSKIRFSSVIFAGNLAEVILVKDNVTANLPRALATRPAAAAVIPRSGFENTALCVVRKEPAKAGTLMETAVASQAEDQALRALGDTLIGCVPSGVSLRLNRPGLRALLAIAAYRLVHENPSAGNA